ncbi:MAG: hypothetical protein NT121_21685, partial [Chloroflexi bacterium]|nr:hypothetical protein [Chloroflexota bacterium]
MKPKQQVVAFVSIIIVVLISMVCIIPGISLIEFYKNESQSISRFDVLNKELFNQIPAPKGAVEIEQFSTGIISPSTEHGRYLSTNYRISENSTSEILKYSIPSPKLVKRNRAFRVKLKSSTTQPTREAHDRDFSTFTEHCTSFRE